MLSIADNLITSAPRFPLKPNAKTPATPNGFKDATTDPAQLARWDNPAYNWGMPTGKASGYDLLEVDIKDGIDGVAWMQEMEAIYGPVNTFQVRSQGGGIHYYFRTTNQPVKSSQSEIAPGVDTRGEGGYIVLPGSSIDGRFYTIINDVPAIAPPAWLADILPRPGQRQKTQVKVTKSVKPDGSVTRTVTKERMPVAPMFVQIPDGSRHGSLMSVARKVWKGDMTAASLQTFMLDYNRRWCKNPLPEDELIGITDWVASLARDDSQYYSVPEMQEMLGRGLPKSYHKPAGVRPCLISGSTTIVQANAKGSTTQKRTGDEIWNLYFAALPTLKDEKGKRLPAYGKHQLMINEHSQEVKFYTLYSNSWRGTEQNVQHKRRQTAVGVHPRLNTWGPWYGRDVVVLDKEEEDRYFKARKAATKRDPREERHLLVVDNTKTKGVMRYLSNVQHEGFEEVENWREWLLDSLRNIRVPGKQSHPAPYSPIRGSREMKKASSKPADENFDRFKVVAFNSDIDLNFTDVEITCEAAGLQLEYVATPEISQQIKRAQCSPGYLQGRYTDLGQVAYVARRIGRLTNLGKEIVQMYGEQS